MGVVFYLAQAISVAMYIIGFTEAFLASFAISGDNFIAVATVINIFIFICVYIGASWAIKVQYFILAILAASLFSFFIGAFASIDTSLLQTNLTPHYESGESLFTMFALFFPAVTGIMAGANMSGDLERPSKSIPKGTLWAVLITGVIYLSLALLLGMTRPYTELISNNLIMNDIAIWSPLITAGVFAATLSSALGSMMGAPRILQAFSKDEIFDSLKFFGAGSGPTREPRRATVITFIIAELCILLGDLNAIAPIITMFFMITYGLLNLATFYESVTHNPSYRPTFKYCHWSVSLAGTIGCVGVMFLMNWVWATISILMLAGLHWYIRFREIESRWGDLNSGVIFERSRQNLLRLEQEVYHPKNWRPIILALSGTAWSRPHLAIYGHWLTAGHGILSLGHIVTGNIEDYAERQQKFEMTLRKFINDEGLLAFPAVVISPYVSDGIEALVQCHGIGGLRPNTVLLGWPGDVDKSEPFGATVRLVSRLGRSVIAVRFLDYKEEDPWEIPEGTIDVWWRGKKNGSLMQLLAHLLHQNPEWLGNRIRMLRSVPSETGRDEVIKHIETQSALARITVEPVAIVSASAETAIQFHSRDAAIVIFGFEPPEEGKEAEFFNRMESFAGALPRVLFVDSAGGMELES
ncbi:MAG: amino acid permease [Planctomycetaceae bacterium]